MIKDYFVKVSWADPNQSLVRIHRNDIIPLDLSMDAYSIVASAEENFFGKDHIDRFFTIDFMMPIERT